MEESYLKQIFDGGISIDEYETDTGISLSLGNKEEDESSCLVTFCYGPKLVLHSTTTS